MSGPQPPWDDAWIYRQRRVFEERRERMWVSTVRARVRARVVVRVVVIRATMVMDALLGL